MVTRRTGTLVTLVLALAAGLVLAAGDAVWRHVPGSDSGPVLALLLGWLLWLTAATGAAVLVTVRVTGPARRPAAPDLALLAVVVAVVVAVAVAHLPWGSGSAAG
ncbi:hypothetical protein [Kineococcus aurantiacus]|uniref:Uncharacterized protein n=1 Tax=Kineococcus aurantiacus TaxID=37633 RepID=A0A7Y9DP10_9ACTN|nr:hypothetical protein [Kineococcus aurantiacus]NYD24153.1 hypothetical protein [Kineococcus aurantiacus]